MSHERNIELLNKRRIIYSRFPINDLPTHSTEDYDYYDEESIELVNKKYKKDFKKYNYEKINI